MNNCQVRPCNQEAWLATWPSIIFYNETAQLFSMSSITGICWEGRIDLNIYEWFYSSLARSTIIRFIKVAIRISSVVFLSPNGVFFGFRSHRSFPNRCLGGPRFSHGDLEALQLSAIWSPGIPHVVWLAPAEPIQLRSPFRLPPWSPVTCPEQVLRHFAEYRDLSCSRFLHQGRSTRRMRRTPPISRLGFGLLGKREELWAKKFHLLFSKISKRGRIHFRS